MAGARSPLGAVADERVVVVGGGPVGLVLALVLARYDVPSVVLEARAMPTPRDESRAITWMPRALELLDWLGLGGDFARLGLRRTAHEFWDRRRPLLALRFDQVDSPHAYTLQLPQHDTECLLEAAARATGRVEVRRRHRAVHVGQDDDRATVQVEAPGGGYRLTAPWAVGCDGARSAVRRQLGIAATRRDYGADSAVADFELDCDLPPDISRVVLDPARPYGFFCFAPGRWRFIYRLNAGEDRLALTSEAAATALLAAKLPGARVRRFLWASAFRLGSGQAARYRAGRWLLAGDAAHAMGPSAGAGMMIGVLEAWRLSWRLALAAQGHPRGEALLDDYDREQHAGADQVQDANALIFRNIALSSGAAAIGRALALRALAHLPRVAGRMTEREALVAQVLPVAGAADRTEGGPWESVERLGAWQVGRRAPRPALGCAGVSHVLLPIGRDDAGAEAALAAAIAGRVPVPVEPLTGRAPGGAALREPSAARVALALVRPDQHVAALYQP